MADESKCVVLSINLTQKEYDENSKIRDLIDTFTTAVNDIYIDRFRKQMNFDAEFSNPNTMIFTLDDCKYIDETNKILNKLLQNKKFKGIEKRITPNEQLFI